MTTDIYAKCVTNVLEMLCPALSLKSRSLCLYSGYVSFSNSGISLMVISLSLKAERSDAARVLGRSHRRQ